MRKQILKIFITLAIFFMLTNFARAAEYYLAPPSAQGSAGCGGVSCDGSIENPWHDLNYALNSNVNGGTQSRVRPGDVLYLRGGVHETSLMDSESVLGHTGPVLRLETTNAGSPTTTIKSYPGEWAILDGGNTRVVLFNSGKHYNILFENFEVRNGNGAEGSGLVFGDGHNDVALVNSTFRNLYIHNNGDTGYDNNPAGLHLAGDTCVVEYCTFEDNGLKDGSGNYISSTSWNPANLVIYEYYDSVTTIDTYPRKSNIIRYNKFVNSIGVKYKGNGNYVNTSSGYENALVDRQPTWGDEIHHNVFLNNYDGIVADNDFLSMHHNIFVGVTNHTILQYPRYGVANRISSWENSVYNNTFFGCSDSITANELTDGSAVTYTIGGYNWDVYNNLVIAPTTYPFNWFSYADNSTHYNWPMREDHNGIDSSTGKSFGRYLGVNKTLAQWQTLINPRTNTNTLGASDIYTNISVNVDYTLPLGSPAISAGRNGEDLGAIVYGENSWVSTAGYFQNISADIFAPSAPSGLAVQ